jgi:hypothetical protein
MKRLSLLVLACSITAMPAEAAVKTQASRNVEKGVAVWRGAKPAPTPAPIAGGTPRIETKVVVAFQTAWPSRGLRIQGFYHGDGLAAGGRLARRPYTQGFFADRTRCE